jgi:ubiquinone/menaquinone biosynthesis C-methylase UbiE
MRSLRFWLIGGALSWALACDPAGTHEAAAPSPSSGAEEAPQVVAAPVDAESSVRQGINAPYFAPDGFDRFAQVLEAESREAVARRDEIVDAMGLEEGMVVADIGAGTGLFTTEIARRVGDHGAVFAVDIVPAFLDQIRERVEAEELTNVTVVLGEERATGLEDASVDLAFMCDTYHHIEYPQTYMASLFRTLRPGATLVLIDFERVEGKTSPTMLKHVRADKQTVIEEVSRAGFVLESETELLEENYYLRFLRP